MPQVNPSTSAPKIVSNPLRLSWRNVILGLFIGTTLIGGGLVAFYYFELKSVSSSARNQQMFFAKPKETSPSATPAQPRIITDETKTNAIKIDDNYGGIFSFEYPKNDWYDGGLVVNCVKNCEKYNIDHFEVNEVMYSSIESYLSASKPDLTDSVKTKLSGRDSIRSVMPGAEQAGGSSIVWFVIIKGKGYEIGYKYKDPKLYNVEKFSDYPASNPDIISTFKFLD